MHWLYAEPKTYDSANVLFLPCQTWHVSWTSRSRYRLGVATIVDVLTSQEALNQAEVDVVNARFDYLRARAQIEALIGRKL